LVFNFLSAALAAFPPQGGNTAYEYMQITRSVIACTNIKTYLKNWFFNFLIAALLFIPVYMLGRENI